MHWFNASLFLLASISLVAQTPQPTKEEQLAIAKKYPGLHVQASVGTRTRAVPGSSYMKTMTISPAVVIESAQTQPMAAASITCLLITMDTGDKYRRGEQACKISLDFSFDYAGPLVKATLGPLFNQAANTLVDAFCQRVKQLHG